MKTISITFIAISMLFFCACKFSAGTSSGNKTAENLKAVSGSSSKIRNQILLEKTGGLKVESAFLMKDNGELVPEDNILKAGERFKLILKLSGWKTTDGKVRIGSGERLLNSNNVVMLQEDDLFANTDPVSEEDAQVITLIMDVLNTETIYDFYKTEFKVWNKNAAQSIRGSYQFRLKKP
jgi:hypothetical protein